MCVVDLERNEFCELAPTSMFWIRELEETRGCSLGKTYFFRKKRFEAVGQSSQNDFCDTKIDEDVSYFRLQTVRITLF